MLPHTAKEGPVRIQYKCLVPMYVFPEIKLLFPKQNYNVQSPSSYTHISVRDFYISRKGLYILLQGNIWTDPGNIWIAHRHMNVEIGTEAAQFPEKEYKKGISLQCMDEWTIKTPTPICSFWPVDGLCGIVFNRLYRLEIHSLMGDIFDPACELLPPWTKEL